MPLRFELTKATDAATRHAPRTGTLHLDRTPADSITFETPGFLKYTRRGLQPHMVREVEGELTSMPHASRVQLEDFLERDFPSIGKYTEGLHKFVHMDRSEMLVLDTLDPTVTQRTAKTANKFLGVDSEGGTKQVTPEMFSKLVNALKPDVYVALADYIEEPLPSLTKGKRIAKSVERTGKWMDQCLRDITYPAAMFAPVMGSLSTELRDRSAAKLATISKIDGYAFNETCLAVPFDKKLELVRHSLETLEPAKPRYMVGVSSPDQVLKAIMQGIDVFDSSYPFAVTEQGLASTYLFDSEHSGASHVDLWQESMFEDFGPLVDGCECFACKNHHRSYVHHLLMTKEMLATVLLQIHNMHWYNRFFTEVRASLRRGDFEQSAQKFLDRYGCMAEEPAGQTGGAKGVKRAFAELELLATQTNSPTTKIQRKRHNEEIVNADD